MVDGIEIQGLVKDYPRSNDLFQILCHPFRRERVRALAGIDLSMPRGGIYALLGPNGAGKTTLLKILAGLLLPDAGRVCIDGVDLTQKPDAIRQAVGFIVCDERSFYWRLTARENLRFFASLNGFHGVERDQHVARCLAAAGIEDQAETQFMRLSTGMRQKLAVARGLLSDPSILLMDEPTRSLDPESRALIHTFVTGLVERDPNRIILYSTHDLAEAEAISSHVIVIRNGRIVTKQRLDEPDQEDTYTYRLRTRPSLSKADLQGIKGVQGLQIDEDAATVRLGSLAVLDQLIGQLRSRGLQIIEVVQQRSSLLDLYMESATTEP